MRLTDREIQKEMKDCNPDSPSDFIKGSEIARKFYEKQLCMTCGIIDPHGFCPVWEGNPLIQCNDDFGCNQWEPKK